MTGKWSWGGRGAVGASLALAVLLFQDVASAQTYVDARRMAMAGLLMKRDEIVRYNVAYRAAPRTPQESRVTIPIPIGILQLAGDPPTFDPQHSTFNAFELLDLALNPPLYLELREAPVPNSDVELTVGKNELRLDLADAQAYIPADDFTLGAYSRPLDVGFGVSGFRVGVSGFIHNEMEVDLSDNLRAFLREADPATPDTRYFLTGVGTGQIGFAAGASYAVRALPLSTLGLAPIGGRAGEGDGVYVGAGFRYYLGAAFAGVAGETGMTTGDTIFGSDTPLVTDFSADVVRSSGGGFGDLGRGVGLDLGVAFVSGPVTVGFGINDVGATLTWSNSIRERYTLDPDSNTVVKQTVATGQEAKTKLPVSYLLSGSVRILGTQVGGDFLHSAGGVSVHLGAEQSLGPFAVRGGVSRDTRERIQFGLGGGVRLGAVSLDVGLMTHSQSFSGERGLRLGTSVSIY